MAQGHRRKAGGFTLLELAVVTVILGILLAVLRPSIGFTQAGAMADQIERIADTGAENWMLLTSAAQIDPTVPDPILASGYYMTDAIVQGLPAIAPAYKAVYKSTNIKPLTHLAVQSPLYGNGTYALKNFPNVQLAMAWQPKFGLIEFIFSYTPVEVTQLIADRIQSGTTLNMGNNMYYVGPTMYYNCNYQNYCTVHLVRQVAQ